MSNRFPLTEDGGVLKNPIFIGHPNNKEQSILGQEVHIKYVAEYTKANVLDADEIIEQSDEKKIVLGDGTLTEGLDIAVMSMKLGDRSEFIIQPSYFGTKHEL